MAEAGEEKGAAGSVKKRVAGAVEFVPFIGPPLKYLILEWGVPETLFALAGFVIAWAMVWGGVAPPFIVSRYAAQPTPTPPASRPNHIGLTYLSDFPDDLQPYLLRLQQESAVKRDEGEIKDYRICLVESRFEADVSAFGWRLRTDHDYALNGFAFVVMGGDSFRPLKESGGGPSSISFGVPNSRKNDKLLGILRVASRLGAIGGDCKDLIRSEVN